MPKAVETVMIIVGSAPTPQITLPLNSTASSVDVTTEQTLLEETQSPPVRVSRQEILEALPGRRPDEQPLISPIRLQAPLYCTTTFTFAEDIRSIT